MGERVLVNLLTEFLRLIEGVKCLTGLLFVVFWAVLWPTFLGSVCGLMLGYVSSLFFGFSVIFLVMVW